MILHRTRLNANERCPARGGFPGGAPFVRPLFQPLRQPPVRPPTKPLPPPLLLPPFCPEFGGDEVDLLGPPSPASPAADRWRAQWRCRPSSLRRCRVGDCSAPGPAWPGQGSSGSPAASGRVAAPCRSGWSRWSSCRPGCRSPERSRRPCRPGSGSVTSIWVQLPTRLLAVIAALASSHDLPVTSGTVAFSAALAMVRVIRRTPSAPPRRASGPGPARCSGFWWTPGSAS